MRHTVRIVHCKIKSLVQYFTIYHENVFHNYHTLHFLAIFNVIIFISVPSKPVGLENGTIPDEDFSSSSNGIGIQAYLARLNELHHDGHWCSEGTLPSEWLQVFLGKQYTLTHIALQGIGGDKDVTTFKVKYEKTKAGTNWITYSKSIDGNVIDKVMFA